MKKSLAKLATLAFLSAAPAMAKAEGASAIQANLASGDACKMALTVSELRTPYVAGTPLGSQAEDVILKVGRVSDKKSPLCAALRAQGFVKLSEAEPSVSQIKFKTGDRMVATALLQPTTIGERATGQYALLLIVEEGIAAGSALQSLALAP